MFFCLCLYSGRFQGASISITTRCGDDQYLDEEVNPSRCENCTMCAGTFCVQFK